MREPTRISLRWAGNQSVPGESLVPRGARRAGKPAALVYDSGAECMTTVPNRTFTTLSKRGLRHDILPMRLYHKAKKLGTWDPRDIDLTQDCQDWLGLPDEDKERLRSLILGFQAGEEAVTLDLTPLI